MLNLMNVKWFQLILLFAFITIGTSDDTNLTCYQCVRNKNVECEEHELLPCPSIYDRCVTHIAKSAEKGFVLKRECGLGPCQFDDAMINRGLGLEGCDRSRDEYFCVFCCKGYGCNKSGASRILGKFNCRLYAFVLINVFLLLY